MYVSRSDSQQQNKKRRRRRLRRLVVINFTMLALILILGAVFWSTIFPSNQSRSGASNKPGHERADNAEATAPSQAGKGGEPEPKDQTEPTSDGQQPKAEETNKPEGTTDGPADSESEATDPAKPDDSGEQPPATTGNQSGAGTDDPTAAVNLAFVGDILLGSSVETTMRSQGFGYPFSGALDLLAGADLTAGNLEGPITTRGVPAQNKQYVFKGAPDLLKSLTDSGFDVVSLANNHTLDQGAEGLLDTIKHLDKAGLPHMGGGNNDAEAFAPVILEANGVKVAYIGLSRVVPETNWKADKDHPGVAETYDSTRAVAAIKRAKEEANLVVIMVHWGVERAEKPVEHQTTLARQYIDAGADLVIGSHPHVLQGFEQYKGKWIAYSLGNFVFNETATPRTKDTGVLNAACTKSGECKLTIHPMVAKQSRPAPADAEKSKDIIGYLSRISLGAKVDQAGHIISK
ncbi:CapA family protein [Paenibacillus sp. MMS18-CY102]|uniref:CapA family protein n=1 Tax=Paenibacillus sp. MMS18-CY102 TaxID=2682849 RepID=UPI001365EE71|nr:CapA family protein [Paenibacillus sp. MMS18-CY102]MWC28893.1 CapA family protein [Paenibacillus sp. MMS18-CY102]